jgi:hypothetical protein
MSDPIEFKPLGPGVWRAQRGPLAATISKTRDGKFYAQVYRDTWALYDVTWSTLAEAKEWCLQRFEEESK